MTTALAMPPEVDAAAGHDDAIAHALRRLAAEWQAPPTLEALAAGAGLSAAHFQRLFKARVGISPKRFAQHLSLTHAKALLARRRASLLDAALDSGLSGPSRLHDLFVAAEAMTPGEYKSAGRDLVIRWGVHASPLGPALLATTDRGLCWLSFGDEREGFAELADDWRAATLVRDDDATRGTAAAIFARPAARNDAAGARVGPGSARAAGGPITVLLRGTNFQMQVWRALLRIQPGAVTTYGDLAASLAPDGSPRAVRAVAAACGANRVSYLIPCHRVIQSTGALCGYRWGLAHKRALLALEADRAGE